LRGSSAANNPTMHILLDMDGVIADFENAILSRHGVDAAWFDAVREPGSYELEPHFTKKAGVSFAQALTQTDAAFWDAIPALPWSDHLLTLCCRRADHLTVVTVSPHAPGAAGKATWFERHVLPYRTRAGRRPELAVVANANDKHAFGQPDTVLIDDREQTIVDHDARGHAAILFPAMTNSRHDCARHPLVVVTPLLERMRERCRER
jgi:hypothetical protein